jgi:hypothetical protein
MKQIHSSFFLPQIHCRIKYFVVVKLLTVIIIKYKIIIIEQMFMTKVRGDSIG